MEAAADLKKKGLFRVSPVHKAVYNCMEYIRLKFCDDQGSTSLTKKLLLQILQHIYIYIFILRGKKLGRKLFLNFFKMGQKYSYLA